MKRHILASSLAAIAATTTAFTVGPTKAYAWPEGPLSRGAIELLNLDSDSDAYRTKYSEVEAQYNRQAVDYSLDFDDWLTINSFINHESLAYGTEGAKLQKLEKLDLDALTWEAGAHGVEAFFVNEGAGYWNQFGYSTSSPSNESLSQFWYSEDVTTMWSGIASTNSLYANGGSMTLGEGYEIGNVDAGDTVNFFLKNPYGHVFDGGTVETTLNTDRLEHVTTYQYKDFLVLAYEDIHYGGDLDYNDVVIAVRGLVDTTPDIAAVPEPASVLGLLGLGLVSSIVKRKRQS